MKSKTTLLLTAALLLAVLLMACGKKEDAQWKYFGDQTAEASA